MSEAVEFRGFGVRLLSFKDCSAESHQNKQTHTRFEESTTGNYAMNGISNFASSSPLDCFMEFGVPWCF